MTVFYTIETFVDPAQAAELFQRSGLRRPVEDLDRIRRMFENANLIICAWDEERLVGVARALTDFSYCCYLSDLAVDPEYQRNGIGKELVRRVREAIGEESMLLLLAAPTAEEYYPHLGFEKVENGWQLPRRR
jgi:N-acetylglutamate synthase-like GNAT family acetyltransferase